MNTNQTNDSKKNVLPPNATVSKASIKKTIEAAKKKNLIIRAAIDPKAQGCCWLVMLPNREVYRATSDADMVNFVSGY